MLATLKRHFGYDQFRPLQQDIIQYVLDGKDCLALMPTGGGKSLCYQMPALLSEGITIVVSPLIALMKDQVDQLTANGVPAAYINSSLSFEEIGAIRRKASDGRLKLLYVAPERLANPGFREFVKTLNVRLLAIDEAHCVSEWGHDFRPEYANLLAFRREFAHVPTIALTATATPKVSQDIIRQLGLQNPKIFTSSFDRPNLTYSVVPKTKDWSGLYAVLEKYRGESAILYCFSRKDTESLAADLKARGYKAAAYHAGLSADVRNRTQERFIKDEIEVVVATVAFGMGIDKPDVRLVAHCDLPKSIEGYYQETGRAGRDGLPSECVLFYTFADKRKQTYFISMMEDPALKEMANQKLDAVIRYGDLRSCRRQFLLQYFNEKAPGGNCGGCDVCLGTVVTKEFVAAVAAKMAPSAKVPVSDDFDVGLFEHLRAVRKRVAIDKAVPPYIVFGDVSLRDMAGKRPSTDKEFLGINGVGEMKLKAFGEIFMKAIREYGG